MAQIETFSADLAEPSIMDRQRERSGGSAWPNPGEGHRLMRAFLNIEQAALREKIVNFVMELSAMHDKGTVKHP
jgi:hypothetical protein